MGRLVGIPYSPWTARARWVLELANESYRLEPYRPLLDEPRLRWGLRRVLGNISVPIYMDDTGVYDDSRLIALRAHSLAPQLKLFPEGEQDELNQWVSLAEELAFAGRALVILKTESDPTVLESSLQSSVPSFLVKPFLTAPKAAMLLFRAKYKTHTKSRQQWVELLRGYLAQVQKRFDGRSYLLTSFSYADIALATALQFVSPVGARYIPLPEAMSPAWEQEDLVREFSAIFEWRTEVFKNHWPIP